MKETLDEFPKEITISLQYILKEFVGVFLENNLKNPRLNSKKLRDFQKHF